MSFLHLQESGEMYLENIFVLKREIGSVRSIDVVERMGFSKPSVSRAIGILKEGGFVTVDKNGYISLTDVGEELAIKIYERHNTLSALLIALGVSEEVALSDACRIEHHISDESFDAIKKFISQKG